MEDRSMKHIIRHLMDDIPALRALRGWERFKAEEAIDNALCDAIDEHDDFGYEPGGDDDDDPDGGDSVVPFRRAA